MKKLLLLAVALCSGVSLTRAQDVIVKNNDTADEIQARVLEVSGDEVKYKKWSDPEGPTFILSTSEIFLIKYRNGEKQTFSSQRNASRSTASGSRSAVQRPAGKRPGLKGSERGLFRKGDFLVDAGVGAISVLYGSGYKTQIPPIGVSAEYGVWDNIDEGGKLSVGVGASFQYARFKLDDTLLTGYGYGDEWETESFDSKFSSYIVGAHATAHYYLTRNLDGYATLMLGYNIASMNIDGDQFAAFDTSVGGFAYGFSVGARYYVTDCLHLKAELGYGVSVINVGIGVKF